MTEDTTNASNLLLFNLSKKKEEKKVKIVGATAKIVEAAFAYFSLKINGDGSVYDKNNIMIENPRDFVETYHDLNPYLDCEKRYFDSQIRNLIKVKRDAERKRLINFLAVYEPDPDRNLEKYCREMLYGTDFESAQGKKDLELFEWGIRSFFIQMKRKMKGLRIFDHKVIVFIGCGTEGDQKTESAKMLLSPLECLFSRITIDEIVDWSRNYPRFMQYFGMLCDDLGNTKLGAQQETVKMVLTSDCLSPRKLGGHTILTIPNNSTTIATSNLPVCEIFKENSSVRRFLELFVTVNPKRFLTLKELDFVKIFKSVKFEFTQNEIEQYLDNMRELIVPLQKEAVYRDIFDEFVDENCVQKGENFVSSSKLHQELILYIDHKRYSIRKPSIQSFGRIMNKKYGILSMRSPSGSGKGYYINEDLFNENKKRRQDSMLT